jgi:hypothetical protein
VGNWIIILFHIQPLFFNKNEVDMSLTLLAGPTLKSEFVDDVEYKLSLAIGFWVAI